MSSHTPRKIPSILGIILILALMYILSLGSTYIFNGKSIASKNIEPQNVQITNVSDTSFTVTWQTNDKATGAIFVSAGNPKPASYFDERDKQGKMNQYENHSVTIRDALPDTAYKFRLLSDGKNYPVNNGELTVTTGKTLGVPKDSIGPAYGSIKTADDKPAAGSLVYLSFDESQTLSTIVSESGSWLIPINLIRTTNLQSTFVPDDTRPMKITVKHSTGVASIITDIKNDSPVPVVTIGKNYNFRMQAKANIQPTNTPTASTSAQVTPPVIAANSTGGTKSVLGEMTDKIPLKNPVVAIIQPKEGAASVSDLPLFSGTGIPGKILTLSFANVTKSLTIADDGIWRYAPEKSLAAGKQSVTVKSVDINNEAVTITRKFEILKSGTQVLGDATPSASIQPTRIPTPTARVLATPTPTRIALNNTPTPVATRSVELVPGGEIPTLIILIFGLALVFGGLILAI
jgi:hypothetical protein